MLLVFCLIALMVLWFAFPDFFVSVRVSVLSLLRVTRILHTLFSLDILVSKFVRRSSTQTYSTLYLVRLIVVCNFCFYICVSFMPESPILMFCANTIIIIISISLVLIQRPIFGGAYIVSVTDGSILRKQRFYYLFEYSCEKLYEVVYPCRTPLPILMFLFV